MRLIFESRFVFNNEVKCDWVGDVSVRFFNVIFGFFGYDLDNVMLLFLF